VQLTRARKGVLAPTNASPPRKISYRYCGSNAHLESKIQANDKVLAELLADYAAKDSGNSVRRRRFMFMMLAADFVKS
jgi:hypothetical protein